MNVCTTFEEARSRVSGRVGLVPTMGYLHEGHLRLVETSAGECDVTIVTVFVNPLQFDDDADLGAYPRDLDRDVALAEEVGADVVVAPSVAYMYPHGPRTTVTVDGVRLIDSLTIRDGEVDRGEVLPSSSILYGGT